MLQARASWGSICSHTCGVIGWPEQGQVPGSLPLFAVFRLPEFTACWFGHFKLQFPPQLPFCLMQQQLLHGNEMIFLLL